MTILLAAAILLAQSAPPDEKRIQELVTLCGSEDIAEREAATRDLYALGEAALPLLEKASKEARGEVKARVDKVISELTLPARWVKDVVEGDWNQIYQKLDQAIRNKELDKPQAVRVLSAILLNENVTPDQRQAVLEMASNQRLRELWSSLVQLMAKEDPYQNYYHYLQRLRPPKEAAGAILKMIPKMQNSNQSWQLLELARSLKPERALFEECLTAIMEGDDVNLKNNAMSWLQQGRLAVSSKTLLAWWRDYPAMRLYQLREAVLRTPPSDGGEEVINLLKSNQADDTSLAIEYVSRQRIVSAAAALAKAVEERPDLKAQILQTFRTLRCEDQVRKWISGEPGPGRRSAIALAAELGWTAAGPEITGALSDGDVTVRREAAGAAGALKIAEAAKKLEELVRDADGAVRRAALVSLAQIRRTDATKAILAQLRSDDPDLQAAAVEALPYVDAEQALAALTGDEALGRGITRHALAVLIVKGGTSMLHRVMARVQGKITPDDMQSHIRLIQTTIGR